MKVAKTFGITSVVAVVLTALIVATSGIATAQEVDWGRIIGIQVGGDLVGVGSGQVAGAAPWETTRGSADVDLGSGKTRFSVTGLTLAVGSFSTLSGLPIGTTAGVTMVKGTLVCDLNGSGNGGNSVVFDTPAVPLDTVGNASFRGSLLSAPSSACAVVSNDAFLIRIVQPAGFADLYIAFGAVQQVE